MRSICLAKSIRGSLGTLLSENKKGAFKREARKGKDKYLIFLNSMPLILQRI
jgi:hypothetical protein